jgi:hypothetical protein
MESTVQSLLNSESRPQRAMILVMAAAVLAMSILPVATASARVQTAPPAAAVIDREVYNYESSWWDFRHGECTAMARDYAARNRLELSRSWLVRDGGFILHRFHCMGQFVTR